ncbi:MAG TPA: DUF2269 family protein [Alphaproteobacteria bacterium]|nr:DUF2269 family protein [Alphaproteobacteria bacterium]
MTWYDFFKFLHVASAVIWIGGAFIMVILGVRADRANDNAEIVQMVRQVAWAGERIYMPASIATLVFGLIVAWMGNLWANLWIILGLVGIAITIATGILVLTPRTKRVETSFASGGATPAVVATCREILTIAKFDLVLLFTIIADMVLKPTPADWIVLAIMAIVLIVAGIAFLMPVRRASATA